MVLIGIGKKANLKGTIMQISSSTLNNPSYSPSSACALNKQFKTHATLIFSKLSSDWLPLTSSRLEQRVGGASVLTWMSTLTDFTQSQE